MMHPVIFANFMNPSAPPRLADSRMLIHPQKP